MSHIPGIFLEDMALNVKTDTYVYTRTKEKPCIVGCSKNGFHCSLPLGVHALA